MSTLRRWTRPDSYIGAEWPDYYSAGFGQSRDSDALERSNFRIALAALQKASGEVQCVRENHWAVGWIEWIAIHEADTAAIAVAEGLNKQMAEYPVLDEDDFSQLEQDEAELTWRHCYTWRERVAYIRRSPEQFKSESLADLLACVRGRYFMGYASELVSA